MVPVATDKAAASAGTCITSDAIDTSISIGQMTSTLDDG